MFIKAFSALFLSVLPIAAAASGDVQYFGGIDLGSKGTKAFLFSVTPKAGDQVRLFLNETRNTKLVSSMEGKKFTEAGMQEAVDAVNDLMSLMKAKADEKKLTTVTYFVVGSSGVAIAENKDELAKRVQAAAKIVMEFIDARHEGYFGLLSSVPTLHIPISMYIDIGSGNTKLGCVVGASDLKNYKSDEIKFGSVSTVTEARIRNAQDIVAGVKDIMKDVGAAYLKDSENTPCLQNRQHIYWTGGAAWATATFMHPEGALLPQVQITRKDVEQFVAKLTDGTWNQTALKINHLKSTAPAQQAKIKAQAEKDHQSVMDIFVREQLLSGVSIMNTVLKQSNPSATIAFVRDGGYIYGYALETFIHAQKPQQTPQAASGDVQYFGGIDLGSKGTKAFLFSVTPKAGDQVRLFLNETRNTKLVSSMEGKKFTEAGMQEAVDAVNDLMSLMKAKADEKKLTTVTYFVVGSSGVAIAENKDELAKRVQAAAKIAMEFIDARHEGYFGLLSSVPTLHIPISMYIDIGSGNTKLGCVVGASDLKNYKSDEIKFGSVSTVTEARIRNAQDIVAGVKDIMKDVGAAYLKDSENTPCLQNRQHIYWTGGAAWATATFMHPEGALLPQVQITRKDVEQFVAKLTDGTWNQTALKINHLKSTAPAQQAKIKAQAEKDHQSVMDIFVREQLLSGVSIMNTVLKQSNPSATIAFVRDGGYIYGYALETFVHAQKPQQTAQAAQ